MKRLTGTIGILLIAMLFGTHSYAQRGYGNANGQGHFCNKLPDLTTEQQTTLTSLRTAHWDKMQDYRNQLGEKKARLQTLRTADNADMKAINKTIDEIGAIITKMQKSREQHFQDIRSNLTDDQKVYFDKFGYGRGKGGFAQEKANMKGPGKGYGRGAGRCGARW